MWHRRASRLLTGLLVTQLVFSSITLFRGFPYFGTTLVDNAPVWELPIAVWHLPAIELLSVSGYCCGLRNQLVFEARVRGGHVRMKPFGAVVLATSSVVFWSMLAVVGVVLWERNRERGTGNRERERGTGDSLSRAQRGRKQKPG